MMFTFPKQRRKLTAALHGFSHLIRSQPNARVHAAATLAVTATGFRAGLNRTEWVLIVAVVAAVWAAEAVNTALEMLADAVSPEHHPLVKQAKDLAAGAVFVAAACALVVGLLIFGPYLISLFG